MLKDKKTYGLVVVGRKRATIGYINGTRIHHLKDFSSGIPGKHGAGGQSQRRFERLIQEAELLFYRRIIEFMNHEFLRFESLEAIFIGGAGNSKKKFAIDKNIDYRLKSKIRDTIDLPYDGGYEGLRALVNKISNQITYIQYVKEKESVQEFLEELSKDRGLALYGYEEIKKALIGNNVRSLIYSEGFQIKDDFTSIAVKNGVQVKKISKETEEGEMICKSFGGIVALARYRM